MPRRKKPARSFDDPRSKGSSSGKSKGRVEETRKSGTGSKRLDPDTQARPSVKSPDANRGDGPPKIIPAQPVPFFPVEAPVSAPTFSFAELVIAVVGGDRLDIVSLLADSPLHSGVIADRLGLHAPTASKELHALLHHGLVTYEREGIHSLYHLTDRLRTFRRPGMLQIVVPSPAGHWAHLHLDESFGQYPAVPPPDRFLDLR